MFIDELETIEMPVDNISSLWFYVPRISKAEFRILSSVLSFHVGYTDWQILQSAIALKARQSDRRVRFITITARGYIRFLLDNRLEPSLSSLLLYVHQTGEGEVPFNGDYKGLSVAGASPDAGARNLGWLEHGGLK